MAGIENDLVEAARERLGDAVTRAVKAFVALEATAGQLNGWAEIMEGFVDRIESDPPGSVLWGVGARGIFGVSGIRSRLDIEPVADSSDDRVSGRVTFGPEHEGHPGFAHGGVTASVFDELFGMLWTFDSPRKVTEELRVRFLAIAPLGREVWVEATAKPVDGGRFECSGRMFDSETVYAEATGKFVGTRRVRSGA